MRYPIAPRARVPFFLVFFACSCRSLLLSEMTVDRGYGSAACHTRYDFGATCPILPRPRCRKSPLLISGSLRTPMAAGVNESREGRAISKVWLPVKDYWMAGREAPPKDDQAVMPVLTAIKKVVAAKVTDAVFTTFGGCCKRSEKLPTTCPASSDMSSIYRRRIDDSQKPGLSRRFLPPCLGRCRWFGFTGRKLSDRPLLKRQFRFGRDWL